VPDIHQVVIFNGARNKGQKVTVIMGFLELKVHSSIGRNGTGSRE
jgi:hypothetical protein